MAARAATTATALSTRGDGNITASNAAGTSNHNAYVARAPKARRNGRRSASTSSVAPPAARVVSNSSCSNSAIIVQPLDQLAQFGHVFLRQLAMLGEVRHQRRHASAEEAVEQALALAHQPLVALERRRVEVAPA